MLRSFYTTLLCLALCVSTAHAVGPRSAAPAAPVANAALPTIAPLPARSTFKVIPADATHIQQLRQGGLVIYMRHGPSDARRPDQLPLQLDNCDSQRPLSDAGRALLKDIGRDFAQLQLPYQELISSPFCRVQESARLVFGRPGTIDPDLRYTAAMPDADKQPAVLRTRYWISLPVAATGHNRVVVAHGPNIAEIMDYLPPEGGLILFRPLGAQHPVGFQYLASIEPKHWPALLRQLAAP